MYKVATGDTLIARPGHPHEIVSTRRQPLEIYFWAYTLSPTPQAQQQQQQQQPDLAGDALLQLVRRFNSTSTPVVVRVESTQAVLQLMVREIQQRAPGYLQMINALFAKTIVDTMRAAVPDLSGSEENDARSRTLAESLVETAVHYLSDNLSRRFEVRDVAAQVNLSERQLRRLFHQCAGTSILVYLTKLRIERAAQLLLNTDMAIKQIAVAVGYPDTHYFTTLFGREKGITPAAFRRQKGTEFLKR
jgi:AraC family L-rhamnose operon transcriptional activator RhaR